MGTAAGFNYGTTDHEYSSDQKTTDLSHMSSSLELLKKEPDERE
jgi:hypothetical protein